MDTEFSLAPVGDFSYVQARGIPRIKARVIALWSIPFNPNNPSIICQDMILIDRVGSKIQASVSSRHPLLQTLVTGRVYIFSRFRVLPNNGVRFTTHEFRLLFHTLTSCVQTYDVRIPRHAWSLLNTQQLRAQRNIPNRLADCAGVVAAASDARLIIKSGRLTKMITIELHDPWGKMRCVITGNVVDLLTDYLAENWTERPVIVLQFVNITSFGDKALIEGIPMASKLLINMDIDEVYDLTTRMSERGLNYHGPVGYISPNESPKNPRLDFIVNHPKKTIAELMLTNQGEVCIVHGSIVAVIMDGPWYYQSCRCYAELRANGDKFDCLRCGHTIGRMIHRFRFKVEVFDGQDSAVFLLFDREVEALTGFSCEELLNTIKIEKKVIPKGDYPPEIEHCLPGLGMLFKVCHNGVVKNTRDDCFHVMRVCTDYDVIAMFHEHDDDVETPNEAKFCPPFTKIETTVKDVYADAVRSGGKRQMDTIRDNKKVHNQMRRKLFIEFGSDEDDVVGLAGSGVGSSGKPIPTKDLSCDVVCGAKTHESFTPEVVIVGADDAGTVGSNVEGVIHKAEQLALGAEFDYKKKGLVAVKVEPSADAGIGADAAGDSKHAPTGLSLFRGESMEAPLIVDYSKKALGIKVSHAEVEEVLKKIADDAHIIVISDEDDDAGA